MHLLLCLPALKAGTLNIPGIKHIPKGINKDVTKLIVIEYLYICHKNK